MEFLFIGVSILTGAFIALVSAIITSFSQETINDIIGNKNKPFQRLHYLRSHIENIINGYFVLENLFYTISFVLFGLLIQKYYQNWFLAIVGFIILFNITFFLRTLLFAFGRRYADNLAVPFSGLLYLLAVITNPLIKITRFIVTKIGGKTNEEASREELTALVESARQEGSIDKDEYRILKNIMNFSEVLVSDVMTPRTVVFSSEADKTVADIVNLPEMRIYSRFPVWEGESLDDGVVGYVMSKDLLYAAYNGNTTKQLRDFARKVHFIPENAELDKALEKFLEARQHLFVVVDEYGGVEGLLTMEDVLETILGVEIVDEADKIVDLRELAKNRRDKRIAMQTAKSDNI
ncbi:MAG: CNNM domain-containing protein [Bacteroidetes bacterium]|nr:CNNM domain-containing protein [Bacteroidota bacterium]